MQFWKRNLISIWVAQFLSTTGFSLCLPFAPFFIQQLGITDPAQAKIWASVSASSVAVGLAVMAPIWGILADRFGRRLMLLRSQIMASLILVGMGFSPNVYVFVALRAMQGAFTGTINATATLVAATTPEEKQGTALGTLSAAVFTGFMAGPMIGGFLAEWFGYRNTFYISGALLLISSVPVVSFVHENFVQPEKVVASRRAKLREQVGLVIPLFPIMLLMLVSAAGRKFDAQLLPLYVQDILGRLEGAARWTGLINGTAALGAALAGIVVGRLSDRFSPRLIGKGAAALSGTAMLLTGLLPSLPALFPFRFLLAFGAAGIDPVLQSWLSRATPENKRGVVFGYATTIRSLGWGGAPLLSGAIAIHFGFPAVYFAGCSIFVLLGILVHLISGRVGSPVENDAPAPAAD